MRLTIRNSDGTVSQPTNLDWAGALEKLAAYEDADEQGLLVRLPCKVGDTVWWVPDLNDRTFIMSDIVYGFSLGNCGLRLVLPDLGIEPRANHNHLFFTREKAEAALKGERDNV